MVDHVDHVKRKRPDDSKTRSPKPDQLSDIVKDRTKAGAKTEGKKKKEERKRTEKFGRTADRNSNLQEFEAQFVKNKSNFVTRRNMLQESQVSKNIKAGKTTVGKVNKALASTAKNKATLIKNLIKKRKRS
jgi:hypothetical protein